MISIMSRPRISVAVFGLLTLLVSQPLLGADDIPVKGNSLAEKFITGVSSAMHRELVKSAGLGEISHSTTSADADRDAAFQACLDRVFLRKGDSWFTYFKAGRNPVELKGVEFSGPHSSMITEADKLNGIDARIHYLVQVKAHRKFENGKGWTAWSNGKPGLMNGIHMKRENGKWGFTTTPETYYSLPKK